MLKFGFRLIWNSQFRTVLLFMADYFASYVYRTVDNNRTACQGYTSPPCPRTIVLAQFRATVLRYVMPSCDGWRMCGWIRYTFSIKEAYCIHIKLRCYKNISILWCNLWARFCWLPIRHIYRVSCISNYILVQWEKASASLLFKGNRLWCECC
jgi:hypothetical protein